jgi:glycosyltransferase involved in cell wall biosynthesis
MRTAVGELVRQHDFDAVHADQLSMAQFAVDLPTRLRVLDQHNAVWTIVKRAAARQRWGPLRALATLEWHKLRSYEGAVCRRFDRVTVVSREDRMALEQAAGRPLSTTVVPIAVDTEALPFERRATDARDVASVATMFYPPNVEGVQWFVREIFPLVRQALPDTRFYAIGSRPPKTLTRLAHPRRGVVVTGYVTDLDPYLRRCGVLVVPVHAGSGMRVKILEAFARGIPVVSTRIGVEGIDARDGEHLLLADEPRAFADAVLCLLRNPAEGERLARAGRRLVEERYDWRTALTGLDDLYPVPAGRARAVV